MTELLWFLVGVGVGVAFTYIWIMRRVEEWLVDKVKKGDIR